MVLSELGRHIMSLSVVARKERPNPWVLRKGRGKARSWAIIRHVGKAVIKLVRGPPVTVQFWIIRPERTLKLANISDIELLIDTIEFTELH